MPHLKTTMLACAMALVLDASAAPGAPVPAGAHQGPDGASSDDLRTLVPLSTPMRAHMLANMRDHLAALRDIDVALGKRDYGSASEIAETRLGLTSLDAHGAAHMAPYMPAPMRDIGTAMHAAASRFARDAQDASATGDAHAAFGSLGAVMQQCVACHAGFRVH